MNNRFSAAGKKTVTVTKKVFKYANRSRLVCCFYWVDLSTIFSYPTPEHRFKGVSQPNLDFQINCIRVFLGCTLGGGEDSYIFLHFDGWLKEAMVAVLVVWIVFINGYSLFVSCWCEEVCLNNQLDQEEEPIEGEGWPNGAGRRDNLYRTF